jgi:hypothetical protein
MRKRKENQRPIGVMIHCSDSEFGDAEQIDDWHRERGFDCIGYNWVILNGCREPDYYDRDEDGRVEEGRNPLYLGAHAKGYNDSYLSICLIGKNHFSFKQIYNLMKFIEQMTTANLIDFFITGKALTEKQVVGHYRFREMLNLYLKKDKQGSFAV